MGVDTDPPASQDGHRPASSLDPFVSDVDFQLYNGDALETLRLMPDESVHMAVTSPPYWGLRDYGDEGQLGLEATPELYVERLVEIFRELRRVLRDDGTLWLNLGDTYHGGGGGNYGDGLSSKQGGQHLTNVRNRIRLDGLKAKDLVGIPWMVAFALRADGWWLRSDIIWHKPNTMPSSVTDRPTGAHEYLFLLSKSSRYFYDADAIREPNRPDGRTKTVHDTRTNNSHPNYAGRTGCGKERWPNELGRNRRSVWEVVTEPLQDAHFATFPQALIDPCVMAGSPEGGVVLDPFMGAGTTALVARRLGRRSIGIELNADYCELAARRLGQQSLFA